MPETLNARLAAAFAAGKGTVLGVGAWAYADYELGVIVTVLTVVMMVKAFRDSPCAKP